MSKQIKIVQVQKNSTVDNPIITNKSIKTVKISNNSISDPDLQKSSITPTQISTVPIEVDINQDTSYVVQQIATVLPDIELNIDSTSIIASQQDPYQIALDLINTNRDLEFIKKNLSELLIKFNNNPKVYTKLDYQQLIIFIVSILSYLLENTATELNDVDTKYSTIKVVKEALNNAKQYSNQLIQNITQIIQNNYQTLDSKINNTKNELISNINIVDTRIDTVKAELLQTINLLDIKLDNQINNIINLINTTHNTITSERQQELIALKAEIEEDIYKSSVKHFNSYNEVQQYWHNTHLFKVPDIISIKQVNYEFYYLPEDLSDLRIEQDVYLRKLGNQSTGTIEENLPIFYIDENGYLIMEQQKFDQFRFDVNPITGQLYVEI